MKAQYIAIPAHKILDKNTIYNRICKIKKKSIMNI